MKRFVIKRMGTNPETFEMTSREIRKNFQDWSTTRLLGGDPPLPVSRILSAKPGDILVVQEKGIVGTSIIKILEIRN